MKQAFLEVCIYRVAAIKSPQQMTLKLELGLLKSGLGFRQLELGWVFSGRDRSRRLRRLENAWRWGG